MKPIEYLILLAVFVGVVYTWDLSEEEKEYQFKCHTDYECMVEEAQCMRSGKC